VHDLAVHLADGTLQHPIADIESSPSFDLHRDARRWIFGLKLQTIVVLDLS
jgi:hypothetical protein